MTKKIRILFLLFLLCFSFYFTNSFALFMRNKDPLYQSILTTSQELTKKPINALTLNEYMIPGIYGQTINVDKSFQKMKGQKSININDLVYKTIKPDISIQDYPNKIIKQGNPLKFSITLLIDNSEMVTFLEKNSRAYTVLITKKNMSNQYLHGSKLNNDFASYQEVENKLKKDSVYCLIKDNHYEDCIKRKKIPVEETKIINKNNITNNLFTIKAGDIIRIDANLGLKFLNILLNQIDFQGLHLVTLPTLLSEEK